MKKRSLVLAATAALFVLPVHSPQTLAEATTSRISVRPQNLKQFRLASIRVLNRDRSRQGLPALKGDRRLHRAAQLHAQDMLKRGYFSHTSPEGTTPTDRYRSQGGQGYAAENIIRWQSSQLFPVQPSVTRLFQQKWMESTGHRQNILCKGCKRFGYGIAFSAKTNQIYAVQMFSDGR